MSGYLRRLATTGAAYTAASILSKLIAVALLPLYTRYLSTTDYGAAEVMFASVTGRCCGGCSASACRRCRPRSRSIYSTSWTG